MFSLFKKTDKIIAFWNWFGQNKALFENLDDDREGKMDILLKEIHKIETGLSYEISNEYEGMREIVISAEGDIDKFPIVKEIVSKAPQIEGWRAVAFRQPMIENFTLEYEDMRLSPSEMFFCPVIEDNALDIIVFGKDFKKYDMDVLSHYGLILLDNVMGEFNCVTKVRHYDFQDLEDLEDDNDVRPLNEINDFIDHFYMNRN